jgi:Actinobacteria/chloroflexi VLRF1 release factor
VPNETADGTRWIEVGPERLATWLDDFGQRHGQGTVEAGPAVVTFRAEDGAVAECHVPFPPLPSSRPAPAPRKAVAASPDQVSEWAERIRAHALAERNVGVLLVRLGGYAAGVFTGPGARLETSKVGSRLVHGRSAAGGQSQQRFARRREKQSTEALSAAADTAATVFGQFGGKLDALVLGGDRRAITSVREDPRLRPYVKLAVDRFLTVPDPKLTVLRGTPRQFQAVRIRLTEPGTRAAGEQDR